MCVIELSHMGKNNGNLDLVCEKILDIEEKTSKNRFAQLNFSHGWNFLDYF